MRRCRPAGSKRSKEYGWNVLEDLSSMLVFDYSSTVNAMMETAAEHGKKMTVYVPESRALDGGRPFVVNALKLGHGAVFLPDAALAAFTRKADVAFIGAETFFPDGSAANTVGSDLVAILCARFGKPLYVPTAMIKVNMRGIEGRRKKELGRDLARYLAAAWPEEMRAATDFCCPDLAIVGPAEITGYGQRAGGHPAGGDVRHEPEVHREDRRGGRMMFRGKEKIAIGMAQPLRPAGQLPPRRREHRHDHRKAARGGRGLRPLRLRRRDPPEL